MTVSIEDFLRDAVDAFRRDDVWDGLPTLALMCTVPGGLLRGVLAFPDFIWGLGGHPRSVLRALTTSVAQVGMPPMPDGFTLVGVVLVSEGYGIDERARPAGYWETHRIADDPGGYEYVTALAVDLEGTAYGHFYRRGAEDSEPHALTSGALVDGLRRLLEAMTAGERRAAS